MNEMFKVTPEMLRYRPEMAEDGYAVGDEVPGRILHAKYSRYMQRVAESDSDLVEALAEHGARFTTTVRLPPPVPSVCRSQIMRVMVSNPASHITTLGM